MNNFLLIYKGGILAGISFIISAIVEINLEATYAVVPKWGEAQLRLYNGRDCNYQINSNIPNHPVINLPAFAYFEEKFISIDGESSSFNYNLSSSNCATDVIQSANFLLPEKTAMSYHFTGVNSLNVMPFEDSPEKSRRKVNN